MVSMGDSISTAYAAGFAAEDFPDQSWSTGQDPAVQSHYLRLRAGNPALAQTSVAKPGTEMFEAIAQVLEVPRDAGYITLTAGSTEVCSSNRKNADTLRRPELFADDFRKVLTQLHSQSRSARVLVLSVPNWYGIWNNFKNNADVSSRWANGACPLLMSTDPLVANDASRQKVRGFVDAYNSHMASICGEFAGFCAFDNYATFNTTGSFSADDLSPYDGLHFSRSGQAKIAAATAYLAGFFPHQVVTPPDTTPPSLTVFVASRLALLRALARGVSYRHRCSEAATTRATLQISARLARRLGLSRTVGRATARACDGTVRTNVARFGRRAKSRLARLRFVRVTVVMTAVDPAGNRATRTRGRMLRRL